MADPIILALPLGDYHLILNALEFKRRELLHLADVQNRNLGAQHQQAAMLAIRHREQANQCASAMERLKSAHTPPAISCGIHPGA